jgi:hypothetical protein
MPARPFVHKWQAIVKIRKLPQKGDTVATEVVLPLWLEVKR